MKKTLFLIVLLLIFSCRGDISNNSEYIEESILNVIVNIEVSESDTFELYFSDAVFDQYHPNDKIRVDIKGSQNAQDLIFTLPEKIYPIKLRLDVGSRRNNTKIKINKLTLSSVVNKLEIKDSDLQNFLKPNKYLDPTDDPNTFIRKTVDEVYDPFFVTKNIETEVMNLFKR